MATQFSIFIFVIGHFFIKKKNKSGFCAWFSGVTAKGTMEKENEKEQNKPTMLAGIHTSFLQGQEDLWFPS